MHDNSPLPSTYNDLKHAALMQNETLHSPKLSKAIKGRLTAFEQCSLQMMTVQLIDGDNVVAVGISQFKMRPARCMNSWVACLV